MSDAGEFSISPEEQPFLDEIRANPDDDAARLVYADWLEERGDVRAEYVRLSVELATLASRNIKRKRYRRLQRELTEMSMDIQRNWLAMMAHGCVLNCRRGAACPGEWKALRPSNDACTRTCPYCHEPVHYCASPMEARQRVSIRHERICPDQFVAIRLFPGAEIRED